MPMPNPGLPPQREEPTKLGPQDLEIRLQQLKSWYPEWFVYSDSLGERPIDAMQRQMVQHWDMRDLQQEQMNVHTDSANKQVQQNQTIAPEYTEQRQQSAPPGTINVMGKVM